MTSISTDNVAKADGPPMEPLGSIMDDAIPKAVAVDDGQGLNNVDTTAMKEVVGVPKGFSLADDGHTMSPDSFFERPVIIGTYDYTSSSTVTNFAPWKLWLNDPMVSTRMKGSTFVRGNMKVRLDVAANPYQYGIVRAYIKFGPIQLADAIGGPLYATDYFSGSQSLGVDIDVSKPGAHEISIPWIFPRDYISVVSKDASPFNPLVLADSFTICQLFVEPMAPLRRADSVTAGTVTFVVRAWVDNFEAKGPTRYNIVTQSGKISAPAAAISKIAGTLSAVPVIGTIAKAVSIGASAVSGIASLFGFSRVRDDKAMLVTQGVTSYALTDVNVNAGTLAFTADREIENSTSFMGEAGLDDMALSRILTLNSLQHTFTWATSNGRGALWDIPVDPLFIYQPSANNWCVTSLAGGCIPFRWWRGSIIYTVRVCCSPFHTGTLRMLYDPAVQQTSGTQDSTWPIGSLDNCVFTIGPGCTTEFEVAYTSQDRWRPIGATFMPQSALDYSNSIGKVSIYVENPLQAPLASQSVTVLVYVRGGPDFQVFGIKDVCPRYGHQISRSAAVQSSIAAPPVEVDINPQSAIVTSSPSVGRCNFGGIPATTENLHKQIFGERILSLRALAKRYVGLGYVVASSDATATNTQKNIVACVPIRGPPLAATAGTGVGITYYNANNYMRHFALGYVGVRGGMRFRIIDAVDNVDLNGNVASRGLIAATLTTTVFSTLAASATTSSNAMTTSFGGQGSMIFDTRVGDFAELEVPDYNPWSFHYAGTFGGAAQQGSGAVAYCENLSLTFQKACRDFTKNYYGISSAGADDFQFIHWQGFPRMYTTT